MSGRSIGAIACGVIFLIIGIVMIWVSRNRKADQTARETIGELRYQGGSAYSATSFFLGGIGIALMGLLLIVAGIVG